MESVLSTYEMTRQLRLEEVLFFSFVVALGAALLLPSRFVWFFFSVSVVAVF